MLWLHLLVKRKNHCVVFSAVSVSVLENMRNLDLAGAVYCTNKTPRDCVDEWSKDKSWNTTWLDHACGLTSDEQPVANHPTSGPQRTRDQAEDVNHLMFLPLSPEPDFQAGELKTLLLEFNHRGGCDCIIDCSYVDVLEGGALAFVMKLRKRADDSGYALVLASVAPATMAIFTITGLDGVLNVTHTTSAELIGKWRKDRHAVNDVLAE
jgi:anti-anti-sigma regulatory factor